MPAHETFYEVMRRHGVTRRSFLKFCSLTAAGLGLGPEFAGKIAHALETKPRTPVVWLHGLECTCCTESFIRSGNPLAGDVILSMISLDYDDTIMAAAGHQAEEILEQTIEKYDGQFILACEGNPPLNEDGMYCMQAGRPYVEKLRHMADHCKAIIAWGSCASWGCVQAARPNPTQAVPIHKVILDKPIVKVPGCPPIAEVMTGVITYMLAFDRLPPLDRQGRPAMFYGQRLHDKCYRRPHFDAGQFVPALAGRPHSTPQLNPVWMDEARAALVELEPVLGFTGARTWAGRERAPADPRRGEVVFEAADGLGTARIWRLQRPGSATPGRPAP